MFTIVAQEEKFFSVAAYVAKEILNDTAFLLQKQYYYYGILSGTKHPSQQQEHNLHKKR